MAKTSLHVRPGAHHRVEPLGEDDAWALVRGLLALAQEEPAPSGSLSLSIRGTEVVRTASEPAHLVVRLDRGAIERQWNASVGATPAAEQILDLCVPLCVGRRVRDLVVAHLGQSLDGRVATPPGSPRTITSTEDLRHTHRLRALFDAVVVGATTVLVDDPRLTTRLVPGMTQARVVIDPRARLPRARRVFTDGKVRSLVVVGREHAHRHEALGEHVEIVGVELSGGSLPIRRVIEALRARGLRRLFIEGGGVTVSRFLEARALDRLHVAIASKIIGVGAPAIQLDAAALLMGGIAARSRCFLLGADVLFDCDLSAAIPSGRGTA